VNVFKSFQNLEHWKQEFLIQANPYDCENFPFILVGNKIDTQERAVTREVAEKWAKQNNNMPYFETSAKERKGKERKGKERKGKKKERN
jgi:Ras-related protein Rab-7A